MHLLTLCKYELDHLSYAIHLSDTCHSPLCVHVQGRVGLVTESKTHSLLHQEAWTWRLWAPPSRIGYWLHFYLSALIHIASWLRFLADRRCSDQKQALLLANLAICHRWQGIEWFFFSKCINTQIRELNVQCFLPILDALALACKH